LDLNPKQLEKNCENLKRWASSPFLISANAPERKKERSPWQKRGDGEESKGDGGVSPPQTISS
jgi:hypothetical protein